MRTLRCLSLVAVVLAVTICAPIPRVDAARRAPLLLTPEAQVPGPGDLGASGQGTVRVSAGKGEVCFAFTVESLSGYITRIQIHKAPAGQEGPAVLTLSPMPPGVDGLRGCVPAEYALLRDMARYPQNYYVNVHTSNHPAGAIRAQLAP